VGPAYALILPPGGSRLRAQFQSAPHRPTKVLQSEWLKLLGQFVTNLPQGRGERRNHDQDLLPVLARRIHLEHER
jgi:hypothetical protein